MLIGRFSTLLVWCTLQSCRKPGDGIHLLLNQAPGNKRKSFPFAGDAERKLKLAWEFEFGILVLEKVNIGNVRSESFLTSNFRPSYSDFVGFRSGDGTSRHLCHHVTVASTRQISICHFVRVCNIGVRYRKFYSEVPVDYTMKYRSHCLLTLLI